MFDYPSTAGMLLEPDDLEDDEDVEDEDEDEDDEDGEVAE